MCKCLQHWAVSISREVASKWADPGVQGGAPHAWFAHAQSCFTQAPVWVTTFEASGLSREEHCVFKWESVQFLSFYSMSASQVHFSTYDITICNKTFMSSGHEALFCHQVLSDISGTAEPRPSENASTKLCSELSPYLLISDTCSCTVCCGVDGVVPVRCLWLPHCSLVRSLPCSIITVPSHDCLRLSVQRPLSKCHILGLSDISCYLWVVFQEECYPADHLGKNSIFSFFSAVLFFLDWFWQQWRMGYIKTAC